MKYLLPLFFQRQDTELILMNLQNIGAKVFRYRGQIPAFVLLLILPVVCFFPCPISTLLGDIYALKLLSFSFILSGVFYRTYAVGFRFDHSSGRNRHNQVAQHLNTTDAYSMSQHPLYFSNGLLWMGILLVLDNCLAFCIGCSYYIVFSSVIIRTETIFLDNTFGEDYRQWKKKRPAFLPNPMKYKRGDKRFNWMRVFATEYPSWVSIIASVLALHILKNSIESNTFSFGKGDLPLVVVGLVVGFSGRFYKYIVVRKWLKKSI